MSELFFTYEPEKEAQRKAYRAKAPGLKARDRGTAALYEVLDISAGGISLDDAAGQLQPGTALELDVLIREQVVIAGLSAQVTRRHENLAGLRFTNLPQRQEERLDKLVLEVQKYLISKMKSGGSHIDDDQQT